MFYLIRLTFNTYSPRLEMYRQIPKMEGDAATSTHVKLGSSVFTTVSDLEKAINGLSSEARLVCLIICFYMN